jgi:hypothetical protein
MVDITTATPTPDTATTWERFTAYLEDVLPKPFAAIRKHGLGRLALWCAGGYALLVLLPVLSILALHLLLSPLPAAATQWVHEGFVAMIHTGYDIDKVSERLKKDAAADVLAKLASNNQTLDYVQYVEFYLTRRDAPKAIPTRLQVGQRADISVRRSQVVRNPDVKDPACAVPDVAPTQAVLSVMLGRLPVVDIGVMAEPGPQGQMHLTSAWWKAKAEQVRGDPTIEDDRIAAVSFGKTAAFEQAMTDCVALKVEATIEVFKQDPSKAGV